MTIVIMYTRRLTPTGNNSFARMKHAMSQHVEHEGDAMFRHTAQVIQDSLKALLAELKDLMSRKVVLPSHKLQCDCCAIVGVQNLHSDDDPIAKPGLQTRETILRILNGVDIAGLKIQSAGPTEHDAVGGVPLSENSADHGNLDIADLETQPEKSIRDDRVDDMSVDGVSVDGESVDGGSVDGRSVDDMIVDDME